MNLGQAITIIKGRLTQLSNTQLDTYITAELQLQQEELENIMQPWFLLTELGTTNCVAEEERLKLDASFLQEFEEGALWRVLDSGAVVALEKGQYDTLTRKYTTTGAPEAYALVGGYFRLRPVPDQVYTLKVLHYSRDVMVSDAADTNQWLTEAPAVLIAKTGAVVAAYVKDYDAIAIFEKQYVEAVTALKRKSEARLHVNMDYELGDDDYAD